MQDLVYWTSPSAHIPSLSVWHLLARPVSSDDLHEAKRSEG